MTEFTNVSIEIDRIPNGELQVSISALDDDGFGHSYQIAGPEYDGETEPVLRHALSERKIDMVRSYIAIWDEIQVQKSRRLTAK